MCAIPFYDVICLHCGHVFCHCNSGDVIVCIDQISPRSPKCKKRTCVLFSEWLKIPKKSVPDMVNSEKSIKFVKIQIHASLRTVAFAKITEETKDTGSLVGYLKPPNEEKPRMHDCRCRVIGTDYCSCRGEALGGAQIPNKGRGDGCVPFFMRSNF